MLSQLARKAPNELTPAAIISGDDWSMQHLSIHSVVALVAHGARRDGTSDQIESST